MAPAILFWQGHAEKSGLKLVNVTGEDQWIARLFRNVDSFSHPHSRSAVFPRHITAAPAMFGGSKTLDGNKHPLVGMFEVITDDDASESRLQQTQRSLHKINNQLSIASLALDVLTLRLEQSADQVDTRPWMDSCQTASRAVIRAGKIANETMHQTDQRDSSA